MIAGLGTDMIEVERIKAKIEKDQGFRELVFSELEISYCESMAKKYEHFAARFAAKEAFLKALGTGWASGTAFNEIEILHDEQQLSSFFLGKNSQCEVCNPRHLCDAGVAA